MCHLYYTILLRYKGSISMYIGYREIHREIKYCSNTVFSYIYIFHNFCVVAMFSMRMGVMISDI
jgi:hypothetical protein